MSWRPSKPSTRISSRQILQRNGWQAGQFRDSPRSSTSSRCSVSTTRTPMRNLDPALVSKRGLGSYLYQLVARPRSRPAAERSVGPAEDPFAPTHSETLRALASWGLPVEPHWKRCEGISQVAEFCQEWAEKRLALDFDTDGVVIKVDDLALRTR